MIKLRYNPEDIYDDRKAMFYFALLKWKILSVKGSDWLYNSRIFKCFKNFYFSCSFCTIFRECRFCPIGKAGQTCKHRISYYGVWQHCSWRPNRRKYAIPLYNLIIKLAAEEGFVFGEFTRIDA